MIPRLAHAIVRLRFALIAGWIALAVVATLALPTLEESQQGSLGDLVPDDAEAVAAEKRALELFGTPALSRVSIIYGSDDGLTEPERREAMRRIAALNVTPEPGLENVLGAVPVANGPRPLQLGSEPTAVLAYLFISPEIGQDGSTGIARLFADRLEADAEGTEALVTGAIPARAARGEIIRDRLPLVELATILMIVVALGLYFRAVAAPVLAVVAVGIAYLISIRLVSWVAQQVGVSAPRELEPVIVALLFGIVTDYVVFFVSRFRAELAGDSDARTAARSTAAALLPVILTAGLIIAGASASLLVAELGFLRAFGPGMAITALVGVLVGVTFVPAVLAVLGRATLWPRGAPRAPGEAREPLSARLVGRRPVLACVGSFAVLAVLALGAARLDVGDSLLQGIPKSNEVREGYEAASRDFAPGIVSPVLVLVEDSDLTRDDADLARLEEEIESAPGVAAAIGPGSLAAAPAGALITEDRSAARFLAVLSTNPLGEVAIDRVRRLERRLPGMLDRAGLQNAKSGVGGDTALLAETVARTRNSLAEVAPVALVVVYLLLAILLRALLAPVILVAASALALLAALGATSFFFEDTLSLHEVTFFVPFAAAILLLALGSDYNVLLARRIWDESGERPFRKAVRVATARASGTIAAAGTILALSFAALALIPVRSFQELAFAMAFGLVLDAFVVRTLLIPAAIALIGPRVAWPRHLESGPGEER